ncbi:Nitrogenase component 1 type Oxidoreductase [Sporobacter termitidis DSM 10068]|uniref:Nitrogenase component 1 type Oxidoreductase n=1 Tax=Sporobacter termitidis DSM 10068 TaxID=1123282 RepID=A0A1M5XCL6_9FIRM|nr:nitrogenase component 1 [Sporobacter termitidis]SHH97540.1 Nitrogenase component 1 type Oxidoreductase [Sporobacter termitidis DSM 10068]
MERLSIYLPPFAGDYTGACSALYELNCLIVIDDAACCTRNYVVCDEPRWAEEKKTAFCSKLKTIEAVLGDEERLIRQTIEAAQELKPEFIAILGSPVPAIIGRDMTGIAHEIEAGSGFPAIGFDTTGFTYYNAGISAAYLKLLKRFAIPDVKAQESRVNIFGFTPLDYAANGNGALLTALLRDNGFQTGCTFVTKTELEQLRRAASADVNLVVSAAGLKAAQFMAAEFGIPYVVGSPLGSEYSRTIIQALKQTREDRLSRAVSIGPAGGGAAPALLIVGEQVISNSLRNALYQKGCKKRIAVASFFGLEPDLAAPGDLYLKSERQLIDLLKSHAYAGMIADPLIADIPAAAALDCRRLPHPAISGRLYWDKAPLFIGGEFEKTIESWIA